MFNNIKFLNPNIKLLAPYFAIIVILLVLFSVFLRTSLPRLTDKFQELNQVKSEEATLQAKVDSLREIRVATLGVTENVVFALPEKNASAVVISQLRSLADQNQLALGDIELTTQGGGAEGELGTASLKLGVTAPLDGFDRLMTFCASLDTLSPIVIPHKVEIDYGGEGFDLSLELVSHWSNLPQTLPKVEEPLGELSSQEMQLLQRIGSLVKPQLSVDSQATTITDRQNPFQSF